jgi:hypothetical protein
MEIPKRKGRQATPPAPSRSKEVIAHTLVQLKHCYSVPAEEGNFESFRKTFYDELKGDASITLKTIIEEFLQATKDEADAVILTKKRLTASIRTSLYYCHMADLAYADGDTEQAWYFTAEASMWAGMSFGVNHSTQVFRDELKSLAKAGARKRAEKYQPLRDFVLQEVAKRNYKSKRNAALTLKADVLELARQLGIGLSEQQAEKTISGWLDGVAFASKQVP